METYIQVNGHNIYCHKRLSGPDTIIFMHQSSGSGTVWEKQWQAPELKDYSLIRIDLPGHGKSAFSKNPARDYTLAGMAEIILMVLAALDIERYLICSISISTNLIGEIASRLKGCRGFFLTGACIISKTLTPANILQPFEFGEVLFSPSPEKNRLERYLKGLIFQNNSSLSQQLSDEFQKTDPLFRSTLGVSIMNGAWSDEIQQLQTAHKPLALVYGKEEKIVKTDYLTSCAGLPKWGDKIHYISQAGHLCNLDQPAHFNELLALFAADVFSPLN